LAGEENCRIHGGTARVVNACGAAGDNQPFSGGNFGRGDFAGADFGVDAQLADLTRDEMAVLAARIEDDDLGGKMGAGGRKPGAGGKAGTGGCGLGAGDWRRTISGIRGRGSGIRRRGLAVARCWMGIGGRGSGIREWWRAHARFLVRHRAGRRPAPRVLRNVSAFRAPPIASRELPSAARQFSWPFPLAHALWA
jgi:hypothetical protein